MSGGLNLPYLPSFSETSTPYIYISSAGKPKIKFVEPFSSAPVLWWIPVKPIHLLEPGKPRAVKNFPKFFFSVPEPQTLRSLTSWGQNRVPESFPTWGFYVGDVRIPSMFDASKLGCWTVSAPSKFWNWSSEAMPRHSFDAWIESWNPVYFSVFEESSPNGLRLK